MTLFHVGMDWTFTPVPFMEGVIFEMPDKDFAGVYFFYDGVSDREAECFTKGKLRMGYFCRGCVLYLVLKIEGVSGWVNAPFAIRKYDHLNIDFELDKPLEPGMGVPFHLFLINRHDKTLKAMRFITASRRFSEGFRKALRLQLDIPFSDEIYEAEVSSVFRSMTEQELAKRAEGMFWAGEK